MNVADSCDVTPSDLSSASLKAGSADSFSAIVRRMLLQQQGDLVCQILVLYQ